MPQVYLRPPQPVEGVVEIGLRKMVEVGLNDLTTKCYVCFWANGLCLEKELMQLSRALELVAAFKLPLLLLMPSIGSA